MATGPTTTLFENNGFEFDLNNSDSGSGVWDEHEHAHSEPCDRALSDEFKKIFLPTVYGIIFILGTVGNSLVVWVMGYQKKLKTKTDKYRLHLSVADLLFVLTLPFWALDATSSWYFGGFLCVAVHVIYTVNLYSSVLILAFISLDRYLAVVHATSSQATRQLLANKVIYLGVWLPAVLLTVPDLVFTKVHEGDSRIFCTHTFATDTRFIWTAVFQLQHILVGFLLPGLVILVCYCIIICKLNEGSKGHQKRKALKTAIILILCFFSCWLPYCMCILMDTLMLLNVVSYSCAFEQRLYMWIFLTESLAYFHCCLNPILYAFLGVKFKKSARSALSTSWGSSHKMLPKKRGAISSVSTESESSSFHSS